MVSVVIPARFPERPNLVSISARQAQLRRALKIIEDILIIYGRPPCSRSVFLFAAFRLLSWSWCFYLLYMLLLLFYCYPRKSTLE